MATVRQFEELKIWQEARAIVRLFGVFSGTQMLRIRKFGENQSGYNAALLELLFLFCAASPESVFAKVMQTPQSTCPGHIAI